VVSRPRGAGSVGDSVGEDQHAGLSAQGLMHERCWADVREMLRAVPAAMLQSVARVLLCSYALCHACPYLQSQPPSLAYTIAY
jgi:hypothetical protein